MAKRPDQYQIDPGEGGATDYKNLPQTGRGHSSHDDTAELHKQTLTRGNQEGVPAPGAKPAPTEHVRRAEEAGADEDPAIEHGGAADADTDKGNPLV